MKLQIISPERILFEGEVQNVSLPGASGLFDVLPHHAPLISLLQEGTIQYETEGKKLEQKVKSGFVEINNDRLIVCIE